MKVIEPLIFCIWLVTIFVCQFHVSTKRRIKIINFFGFIPHFHLFSPKPFLGMFLIRFKIFEPEEQGENIIEYELSYITGNDFLSTNRKLIKTINNLCRSLPKSKCMNNNYELILNFIKNEVALEHFGKIQFSIWMKSNNKESMVFKSRIHVI